MDITKIPLSENVTVSLLDTSLDMTLINTPYRGGQSREIIDKDSMKGAIKLIAKILAASDNPENLKKILFKNEGNLHGFFVCVSAALRIRHDFFKNTETIHDTSESIDQILVKENPYIELEMGAGATDGRFIYKDTPKDIILHFGALLTAYNVLKDYSTTTI